MKIEERYLPFGPLTTYVRIVGEDHGLAPLVLYTAGRARVTIILSCLIP